MRCAPQARGVEIYDVVQVEEGESEEHSRRGMEVQWDQEPMMAPLDKWLDPQQGLQRWTWLLASLQL